jgi:hypothetical protein
MRKSKSKTKTWTAAELKLLHNAKMTNAQIAARIGRTVSAVEHQRRGIDVTPTVESPADYWKDRFEEATKQIKKLKKQSTAVEVLVNEIQTIVPRAYSPIPQVSKRKSGKGSKGLPQTAHLILSDSHVGQIVEPKQTMGLGYYGPMQYLRRLKYVEDSVLGICSEHVTTEIDELVVSVLGDMIHGDLQHGNEAAHIMPIVDQCVVSAHSIAQFIRNCAPHFPKVRIKSVSGNHSRWGTQRKMPTVNRYSSFDTLVYHMAKALLTDIPNVTWDLDEQPFAFYDIYGFKFLAIHGDHLRGGDKALGIPAHALGRELSFNAQVFPKSHLKEAPDYYLSGHLHTPMELPGNIIYNGGFPGTDNYSFSSRYLPSAPSQKLFLVHPKNGRSATWNLSISRGDERYKDAIPYDIPEANLKRLA